MAKFLETFSNFERGALGEKLAVGKITPIDFIKINYHLICFLETVLFTVLEINTTLESTGKNI